MQSKDIVVGTVYLVKYADEELRGECVGPVAPRKEGLAATANKAQMLVEGYRRPLSVRPQQVLRVFTQADEEAAALAKERVARAEKVAELLSALLQLDVHTSQYDPKNKADINLPRTLTLEQAEALLNRFGMQVPQ